MQKNLSLIMIAFFLSVSFVSGQKREVKVGTFSKVAFSMPGKLYLRQGSPQKVELEGDKETLEKVKVETDGDKLVIKQEGNWFNWSSDDHEIKVYVTIEKVDGIYVSGSGSLIGETKLSANELDVKVSGSGSADIDANVKGELESSVSGSGSLTLKGSCRSYEGSLSGSGRIKINENISGNADFSISGSGRIEGQGTAGSVNASISGSGKLLAANLETSKCVAKISGSGDVEISVKNDLDAHISGSGSVSYRGNPPHINSHASGSGSVRKL